MTRDQAKEAMKTLTDLFPSAGFSPTETDLFLETFQRFQLPAVLNAIKRHREKNDFPKPKLAVITGEIGPSGIDFASRNRAPTYSQILRAQVDNSGTNTSEIGDAELFLRVERWRLKQSHPTERPLRTNEPAIRREIISLLSSPAEFNPVFPLEVAETWADFVITANDDDFKREMLKLRETDTRMDAKGAARQIEDKEEQANALFGAA